MRRRHASIKADAVASLGGKCAQCGSVDGLEFDHIDPSTKFSNVSRLISSAKKEVLWAEVAKCQLLCGPCHDKKSTLDAGKRPARGTHGTLSAYKHCGPPKCDACREAMRNYTAATRGAARRARRTNGCAAVP